MQKVIDMDDSIRNILKSSVQYLKNENIVLPQKAQVNIYHHCGLDRFESVGAVFVNIINRDYCKSYVIMKPGQDYPVHYHKIKNETFYVLRGTLRICVNDKEFILSPGEMLNVERGCDHSFGTSKGCIFEEISTMYIPNDSIYLNDEIAKKSYNERRTVLDEKIWEETVANA